MYRWTVPILIILTGLLLAAGCSGRDNPDPVTPAFDQNLTTTAEHAGQAATHLWGYYDVLIDVENETVEAVPNRDVMFSANVVNFLNSSPAGLGFSINEIITGGDYIDVDIDVSITHPFTGLQKYNGYDVRGVFMGDGSDTLDTYGLVYPVLGTDQFMLPDPDDGYGYGAPDGYTRWFNLPEFSSGGMPLFSYTQGNFATPGFEGNATLCPYKYFADGLGTTEDLWTWLVANPDQRGVFSSGATNDRNYYLRFPNDKGVVYGYAVIANWKGDDLVEDHPANAVESVALKANVTPDLYYVDATDNGGDLILDLDVFGWDYQPSVIIIESTVTSSAYELDAVTNSAYSGEHFSTYHVEITGDAIEDADDNEFWVIARYDGFDYSNEFGVPNDADADALSAFFRFDLEVLDESPCGDLVPIVNTLNGEAPFLGLTKEYTGWTVEGDNFEDGDIDVAVNDGVTDLAYGTNVEWVDINTISFDIDLSGLTPGLYDIVVTNGCGAQEQGTGVDLLQLLYYIYVVGDPNIDITEGRTPKDIAIDPSSDQVGIAYNAPGWTKWSDDYANSVNNNTWYNPFNSTYVEIGVFDGEPDLVWYSHETSPWYPGQYMCWSWADYAGWQSTNSQWHPQSGNVVYDMANLQGTGEIWAAFNWYSQGVTFFGTKADYSYITFYHTHLGSNVFFNGEDDTGVIVDNLLAIDFAEYEGSGRHMYILEDLPDTDTAVVELWTIGYNPVYQNGFGEDWLYDAQDITVDSDYNVYVLEENSGGYPVIWAYDDAGTLIGSSGACDTEAVSGDPLRIDCSTSKDPDEVHVLHSDGVTRFAMSD